MDAEHGTTVQQEYQEMNVPTTEMSFAVTESDPNASQQDATSPPLMGSKRKQKASSSRTKNVRPKREVTSFGKCICRVITRYLKCTFPALRNQGFGFFYQGASGCLSHALATRARSVRCGYISWNMSTMSTVLAFSHEHVRMESSSPRRTTIQSVLSKCGSHQCRGKV
eukprot:1187792-Prorocentrum_minimum.AAC.2